MATMLDRDEDDILDEERSTLFQSIEQGKLVKWTEDDLDCIRRADSISLTEVPVIEFTAAEIELHDPTDEGDDESALEHYIPDDIQNDPRPREDRDTPLSWE